MKLLYKPLISLIIFSIGALIGAKISSSNESIFAEISFGKDHSFVIGKRINLANLTDLSNSDKILLISGLKNLKVDNEIAQSILTSSNNGTGIFKPKEVEIQLHILNSNTLNDGIAAICDRAEDSSLFFKRFLTIYGTHKNEITKRMIQVAAWEKSHSDKCSSSDETTKHIWINSETASRLIPELKSNESNSQDITLKSRVSNYCSIAPREEPKS